MGNCVLCKSNAVINRQDGASRTIYNCPGCGVFVVSDLVEAEVKKHVNEVSSFLTSRKLTAANDTVLISFEKANLDKEYLQLTVDQIVDRFPVSFSEQMDMALLNLVNLSSYAGEEIKIDDLKPAPLFYVRKSNLDALSFVIKSMQKAGLIDINYYGNGSFFPCGVTVAPKGWDRVSYIQKGGSDRDILIASAARGENGLSEQFRKAAGKAAHECGLHVIENAGSTGDAKVNFELISLIKSGKVVVCDLSEPTGEAYYTAAFARAKDKICILTCHTSAKKKLQIDPEQMGVLFWDSQESLYLEILNAIRAQL